MLIYFAEKKCEEPLHCKGSSHFISKNVSVFEFNIVDILLINDVINLEQLDPVVIGL